MAGDEWIARLIDGGQIATMYCNADGEVDGDEYWNVNGSYYNIDGNYQSGRPYFRKDGHAERRGDGVAVNIYGEQDLKLFESGVRYFK